MTDMKQNYISRRLSACTPYIKLNHIQFRILELKFRCSLSSAMSPLSSELIACTLCKAHTQAAKYELLLPKLGFLFCRHDTTELLLK
jgi:hypothetical protein